MNSGNASDEIVARISQINIDAPADFIDIDRAVHAGRKQRWRRRLTAAGAFSCIVLAAGSVFALSKTDGGNPTSQISSPNPLFDAGQTALTPERISGRWRATVIDGEDVSPWRDASGLPANIIIGADGLSDQWEVNRACGPLAQGSFVLHLDGSFIEKSPPGLGMQSCPKFTRPGPNLVDVIKRTEFVTVDELSGSYFRTMDFLDRNKNLIAKWDEDTTVKSQASLCEKALGKDATPDGIFTTVQHIRSLSASNLKDAAGAFSGVPGGDIAVYCHAPSRGSSIGFAVAMNGQKVEFP